jgi:hypothetical protein
MDPTHLDVVDFLVDPERKSDHIIDGDGNIKNWISFNYLFCRFKCVLILVVYFAMDV